MKEQMKSFTHLTKPLVLFVLLFALGVGQMWGWSMMYLVGDHWNTWSDEYRMWETSDNSGMRYVYIYMEKDYMFRFNMDSKKVGVGSAQNLDDNDTGVRVYKYDSGDPAHINYSGEADHTYSGIICVHSDQKTKDGEDDANTKPFIWLTRPSVKIRHNWNGTNWTDESMDDKHNGKYEYTGRYGGNYTYAGITDYEYNVDGSPLYKKFTDATLEGSPVVGNRCLFEFNSSGYIGVDDKDSHRGSLKIIKIDTVTYLANGATGGAAPAVTEATYNRASTLATNTGSLVKTNYYFNGWNTQANGKGTHYDAGGPITVSGNTTLYAEWVPRWNIKGSMDEGWSAFHPLDFQSSSAFSGTIELDAHTAYRFKVFDRLNDGRSFGCGTAEHDYTYVGQTEVVPLQAANNHTLMLMTTVGGDYTFNWDSTAKTLQIVYPTTIKHPSMDYVYMEKYSGWNSGKSCNIHYWYTDGSGDHALTSNGEDPKITTRTLVKRQWTGLGYDTAFYTFPVLTDYPKFKAADNASGGTGTNHTSDDGMVTTGHEGHYVYYSDGWKWHTIQVYIELENNGADEGKKGDLGRNVAFNDTSMNTAIICPQKSNYTFGGYYTGDGGTGTQIILDNGKWKKSVADYTTADTAWIHAGDTTKLYAKWTETPRTITLQVSPEGAGSFLVGGVAKAHGDEINAYISTPTAIIRADSIHPAWKFKRWVYSTGVGPKAGTDIYNTVQINSDRNGTLTAEFEPRFTLVGATEASREVTGGMPGWSDYTKEFTVNSIDPVNLTYVCTLNANTWYQCAIHDRVKGDLGDGTDGMFEITKDNHPHCKNKDQHMRFQTVGAGKYVFKIDEFDGDGYPKIKLYWPWQVNFGWKYANADAMSTLNEGGGGTLTVYAHEGGEKRAIGSSGGYIMHGGTVSYTAHPYNDYQLAGWWNDYGFSNKTNMNGDSVHWTVTTENAQLYAKFVEKTDTLKSGTTWSGGTWSMDSQPTADIVAVIKSPVEVDITDAKAKKVLLMQNGGNTGQIEIPAGKELVVRTTIKKTTDGSSYGATGYDDINIGSTLAAGTGALVMGTNDGTNKATVNFAVKAKKVDGHNVNQFIGTPFNDENNILYNYYGTKIYRFMAGHDGDLGTDKEWKRVASTGEHMNGFYGYNILTNQETEPVLWMQGTLNRSAEETITGYYNGSSNTENMFANSWVAPIYIPNFENDDFTNIEKTIYIFNAGTPEDQSGHAIDAGNAETTAAGQYCVLPANSASYVGLTVIPAMQAFSVFATGASPSLKFNYTRLVYNPSTNGTATIVPTRAPRRTAENPDAPTVLRMAATGESGYAAKIVLLERTDFTDNFDDGWDGRFLAGDDAAPQLYAVTPDGNMAINSIPNIEGTLLGFKAGEADDLFTFSFDYDGEALYLYDTQLQTYTRVLTGNTYAFTTTDNTAHNRFILTRNAPSVTTGTEPVNNASQVTNKMMIDNHLYIFRGGVLYDATGRMIK